MGIYKVQKCIFTDLPVENISSDLDGIEYYVTVNNTRHFIRLPYYATDWENSDSFFKENKSLFYSLLINKKWFSQELNFIEIKDLKNLVKDADYPKTHTQKSENLFLQLLKLQKEDGELVQIGDILWRNQGWRLLYFKSENECSFYLDHLASEGLIILQKVQYISGLLSERFAITYKGLTYSIKLQEEGEKSKKCFVAMSFNPLMSDIREAIKKAITKTGYEAIIIDEQNINSDKTINDEIIANLKRCKFCIADFTFHSNGVYFESGFALGQGKKVIYTCRKDEFGNSHFDIKPLQHIIYENTEELTKSLINKIIAFID